MKHIKEQCNQEIYESAQWGFYFKGLRVGVLDIETTGLNPARNRFVLGCLYDVTSGVLHQVMTRGRYEEQDALAEYMKLVNEMDVVVTYNGRKFDVPFLEKRCEAHKTEHCGKVPCYNLDLFQVLHNYSPIKKLVPNMKQKTIENYMGFWDSRVDEISGAESVELFNHYEATGDPEAEKKILLHNNDDVRQLARLTKAITKSDFHKAMFNLGFPVKCNRKHREFCENYSLLVVKKINLKREILEISGIQLRSPINYMGFEMGTLPVTSRFQVSTTAGTSAFSSDKQGRFTITVPLIRESNLAIVDLRAASLENGTESSAFAHYPMYGSGFLVIEENGELKYREINHFVKAFLSRFMEEAF